MKPSKRLAADALKLTARDLFKLHIIDEIIPEPLGAAHRDARQMGNLRMPRRSSAN